MAQRLVYHWKHGWIPLDRAAALSKAHGYQAAADKLLGHGAPAHGAPAPGDGKSHHLERSLGAKHSAAKPAPQGKAKTPPKLPASANPKNRDSTFYGNPKYRSN